jgi:hypothetical protein
MASTIYDITIDAGGDYDVQLLWKDDLNNPINLTGYSGGMKIKETLGSSTVIDCSSYITTNGANGTIDISIPASITSTMSFSVGIYDLEVYSTLGKTYKLLRGKVFVNKEVTN